MNATSFIRALVLVLSFVVSLPRLEAAISGTRTVGPSGNYTSLTAAIADIQAQTLNGALVLELQATYVSNVETFPLNFANLTTTAVNTLTVRPRLGAASLVITSAAAQTVNLDGASFVTFDGRANGAGTTKNLTIENTSATGVAVQWANGAANNKVTFTNLRGLNTSTTAGVAVFGSTTGSGNSNNTIDTCDLAPAAGGNPCNAIFSAGTAGAENSANSVTNCTIADFFDPAQATAGVLVAANNTGWTISNNRFFQTATRTYTTGNTHAVIRIGSGQGHAITGNTIGFATAAGTGTWTTTSTVATRFIAIDLAVGATPTSVQGNTISAFSGTTSSGAATANGAWCGINLTAGSANIGTSLANTIGSSSAVNSIAISSTTSGALVVGVNVGTTGTTVVQGNTIGGLTSANAAIASIGGSVTGIVNSAAGNLTITGNTIGNSTAANMRGGVSGLTTGSSLVSGIHLFAFPAGGSITNNLIQNLSAFGTGTSGAVRGIWTLASSAPPASLPISENIVRDLQADTTNASYASGQLGAVGINLAAGTNCVVSNNVVFNVARTNTGTGTYSVAGIAVAIATNTTVSGNRIYNLSNAGTGTTATTPPTATGILIRSGTTAVTVVNNMISLGTGQTTNTSFIGIWGNHGSTPDPTDRIYHNTVHIAGTAAAGALPSFGFHRGDFSATTRTQTIDFRNNIVTNTRTGGTGAHYAIGNNLNATSSATGWPAGASDSNVLNANASTIGYWTSAQTFAGWKTASASDSESLSGITVNYVNAANDLHLAMGSTPTAIESGGATIASVTVDIDGQTRPGPAGSVNGGAFFPDIGADEIDGVVSDIKAPTFTFAPLLGLSVNGGTLGDVRIKDFTGVPASGALRPRIYYRKGAGTWFSQAGTLSSGTSQDGVWSFQIVAADLGGLVQGDVVSYYLVAEDSLVAPNLGSVPSGATLTSVNNVTAPPAVPLTVTALNELSGIVSVGTGGTFPTLTAAVAAYNANVITDATTFLLTDATYASETFPIVINGIPAASPTNTLTIKPAPGVQAAISGASATYLIQFNGARYVTLDGHNGTTQNSLHPRVDASRDLTLTNTSASTSSAVVWMNSTTTGAGAQHCTVQNCVIFGSGPAATSVGLGAGSLTVGGPGPGHAALRFINNDIRACRTALYVSGSSPTSRSQDLTFRQNLIAAAAPDNVGLHGIFVGFGDGVLITGNAISGIADAVGTDVFGITIGYGGDASSTATGIGDGVINATVTENKIGSVTQTSTFSAIGIAVGSASTGSTLIANNLISGVASNGTAGDIAAGILLGGGTAPVKVLHNTVAMQGAITNGAASTQGSFCLAVTAPTAPAALEVRNNIFTNTQTGGSANFRYAAIGFAYGAPYTGLLSDRNALFCAGAGPGIYSLGITGGVVTGTLRSTLADWQTETGQDANSLNVTPTFVSTTDLHLSGENQPVVSAGVALAEVTTDVDGNPRNAAPDLGADEIFPSTNANLVSLGLSTGTLSPGFSSAVVSYNVNVLNATTTLSVVPVTARPVATIAVNNVAVASGATSPSFALSEGDNVIDVVVTAQDGTTQKTYRLFVRRNIKPVLTLPPSPYFVIAPDNLGTKVVVGATATDAEDGPLTPVLNPDVNTFLPIGETVVTVTATDSQNETSVGTVLVSIHLPAPNHVAVAVAGGAAPSAAPGAGTNGLPADATLTSFGLPATSDAGDLAYVAKWTGTIAGKAVKGTGLFLNNSCLAIVGGDASALFGPGAKWSSFTDPVVEGGKLVSIAKLSTGVTAVVSNFTGVLLEKIAVTGENAAGAGDAKFKKFTAVALRGGALGFLAQLSGGTAVNKVTPANDLGVWVRPGGGALDQLYREGFDLGGKIVASFASFVPGNGSAGHGRGWFSENGGPLVLALNTYTDKSKALVFAGTGGFSLVARPGDVGTNFAPPLGAAFESFRLPAMNDALAVAFFATLKIGVGGVKKEEAGGIFATACDFTGSLAPSELIAQLGKDAGSTNGKFSAFRDPVLAQNGALAFPATIKGATIKSAAATTLWWRPAGGWLTLLAQGGGTNGAPTDLPTGAQWKSFGTLALPADRGPIFTATLVPKFGGVTPATASGVWAMDFSGTVRTLFRTGDAIDVGAPGTPVVKTLRSFALLRATVGNPGVTRSFNDTAQVVWLATFTDKTQAIVTTDVP